MPSFLFFFLFAATVFFAEERQSGTAEDLQLAEQAEKLYRSIPPESPAKFAATVFHPGNLTMVERLRFGIPPERGTMEDLREGLRRQMRRVEKVLDWNVPVLRLVLPKLPSTARLRGEYRVYQTVPADGRTEWRIGWNREYLLFRVTVKDSAVFCCSPVLYRGDSIEFFIQSDPALPVYREIIINPDGKLFDAWHVSAPVVQWGFYPLKRRNEKDSPLTPEVVRTGDGYRICLRVPWKELPGYTKGNAPKPGDEIRFMLIRMEKKQPDETAVPYAMYPVIEGGHNLRTMAVGILGDCVSGVADEKMLRGFSEELSEFR